MLLSTLRDRAGGTDEYCTRLDECGAHFFTDKQTEHSELEQPEVSIGVNSNTYTKKGAFDVLETLTKTVKPPRTT